MPTFQNISLLALRRRPNQEFPKRKWSAVVSLITTPSVKHCWARTGFSFLLLGFSSAVNPLFQHVSLFSHLQLRFNIYSWCSLIAWIYESVAFTKYFRLLCGSCCSRGDGERLGSFRIASALFVDDGWLCQNVTSWAHGISPISPFPWLPISPI